MTTVSGSVRDAKDQADRAVARASPVIAKLVRAGYAAKGFVYVIVGLLAVLAAVGASRSDATGSRGAMDAIVGQPFGMVLLVMVALGLAMYALWQFFRAARDPEHYDHGKKTIFRRVSYAVSGIVHAGLVIAAVKTMIGAARSGDDEGARGWTATLMSYPMGQWLVAIAGLIVAGFGVRQVYKGFKTDLDDQLSIGQVNPSWRKITLWTCRLGMVARGIVFAIAGIFLLVAAQREDPNEARGIGGALDSLQRQPYGPWLLGAVALGLMAYGLYLFIVARYRRIEVA